MVTYVNVVLLFLDKKPNYCIIKCTLKPQKIGKSGGIFTTENEKQNRQRHGPRESSRQGRRRRKHLSPLSSRTCTSRLPASRTKPELIRPVLHWRLRIFRRERQKHRPSTINHRTDQLDVVDPIAVFGTTSRAHKSTIARYHNSTASRRRDIKTSRHQSPALHITYNTSTHSTT
jgi:hypothetical protein